MDTHKLSTARATGCQQFKSNESNGDYKLTSSCFVGESDFHAQILRDDVKIRPPQKWWSVTSEWARLLQSSLRSKYLPVKHRSVIMTIVTVPFNLLVLATSLSTSTIGVTGAWLTASVLILAATACLLNLQRIARREAIENLPRTWKRVRAKWVSIARVMQIRKLVQGIAKQAEKEGV